MITIDSWFNSIKKLKLMIGYCQYRRLYYFCFAQLTSSCNDVDLLRGFIGKDVLIFTKLLIISNLSRNSEYQLNDSASYFLDNLHRLSTEFYLPTDQV